MKILVVDDEKLLVKGIKFNLENEGYTVECCYDGATAVQMAAQGSYDLIILDLMMPGLDGLEACQRIRQTSTVPIIMLTARSEDADKLLGFESGADDYITKPFSLMVLRARVRALLRRTAGEKQAEYRDDVFRFSFDRMEFYKRGSAVELSKTEQRILYLLVSNAGRILTRERLMEWVWPEGTEYVEDNALSVGIRRLRDKLEDVPSKPVYIRTVYGRGYVWERG